MNQADSETKCPKKVSNESILNNYNFDDVSSDQNSICENCDQKACTVYGKHSGHVGTVSNTEHLVDVTEVSQQQQTVTNYVWPQYLLRQAWVYIQTIITTRMSGCPRCNPKSPSSTSVESPSQSSLVSFLSSISSLSPSASSRQSCLSCVTSCHRGRSTCSRASSHCHNARPPCSRAFRPCPKPPPPCPDVKPLSPKTKKTYPRPDTKSPSVCAKRTFTKPKAEQTSSDAEPRCLHAEPPRLNAYCLNPKCPNAEPTGPSLKAPCRNPTIPCPYATPPCPNAKCPNALPSCSSLQPPCPYAKPSSSKDNPPCRYAKPPCSKAKCPHAKHTCPSFQPPCPKANCLKNVERISKTSLYHSFSNDSLCGTCKESLVEQAKVYINKLTSDHKVKCPRCAKQPAGANSKETMASYLRSIFDQAWSYFNTSTEQNTCPLQGVLSNCSITFTSSRVSESPRLYKPRCYCTKSSKTQSCESTCCPKPVSTPKCVTISDTAVVCPTCLTPITSKKPVTCPKSVSCPVCLKPAPCSMFYKCKGNTAPAQSSKKEGTHEHKSCFTPCCMHNSQSIQPSYIMSDKSCWSSKTSMTPLNISPRQVKTPQSVEELKASITGITCLDKSSGNMLGCELVDFRSTIENSKSCVQDLKVSKDLVSEETPSPSSGGRTKSNEVLLEKVFDKPREQLHNKEKICKSGSNYMACVDSKHSDPKGNHAPEKDTYRKDPYNYKYYY